MENDENLAHIRHSLAHLLGASILELYPNSKLTLGPAIDNGFYYDSDIEGKIHEDDLPKIEKKMRELAKSWSTFEKKVVDENEARENFKDNEYKNELIDGIVKEGAEISLYTSGSFTDLCRGGHTENFKDTEILLPLRNKEDVIVLASILEGEAKTKEDMQKVSGILLKRLSIGMALQVDVAKETYKTIGLPTQPINNPGLVSLYAVLNPINTPYLYYVTGKDGTMHYAKTFTEHKANIKKYL